VPPTDLAGETIVMPAVFPDGARIELRYPRALRLAQLGVRPYSSGSLGEACTGTYCGRDFNVFYGRSAAAVAGGNVVERYRGSTAPVELRRNRRGDERLVFRFGRWTIGVWDGGSMTKRDKAVWARSLSGAVTSEGYLVLSARPPLRLARAGEHAGPELMAETRLGAWCC
jgi:hypothetical protein